MLDKAGAMLKAKRLQDQVKKQLKEIFHQEEKGESLVLIRGDKHIEKIVIDGEERKDIKDMLNDAMKQVDKKAEKQMKNSAQDFMSMLGL